MSTPLALVLLCVISVSCFVDLPPGEMDTIANNLAESSVDWAKLMDPRNRLASSIEQAKRVIFEAEQASDDPYNIRIAEEVNFTRLSFDSLLYRDRPTLQPQRYILFNTLPEKCRGLENLPYVVFLTGYGAKPEDYGIGVPFMNELITNGTICCYHVFIPMFFILPTGGYWYTNNDATIPELYLFTEVLTVIDRAMGNTISHDPKHRILAGHSMGGFGAVMNAMRTNMQYFDSVCGLNGGLYIWNLPDFQQDIVDKVIQEAVDRKNKEFINCSYTQPPYRYYADDRNFNTMVATSLAAVFHSDGTMSPKANSPYFSPTLFNPDCTKYAQFFGFRFWLNPDGSLNNDMFNIAPWHSPLGFLQLNYPALQKELSGNLYLSTTYNDTIVSYLENVAFSEALDSFNITHTFDKFYGGHLDVYEGIRGCLSTFAPKVCTAIPTPPSQTVVPQWAFYVSTALAAFFLVMLIIIGIRYCRSKSRDGYTPVRS